MARLVRRTAQQPTKYVIDGKEQWFRKCGLGEDPNKLYWYDEAGKRHEVTEQYPGIRSY